jgi:Fis family transcriptional regulator
LLHEVMRHCDGNQSRAADMLGMNRATLRKKLKDYGLA